MLEHQNRQFVRDFLQFSHFVASKSMLPGAPLWTSKFATSKSMFRARLPSIFITSHKMQRHATPATEFAPCRWRSPDNTISKKTRNTTRLKCCACLAKWRWTRLKWCARHENCNASSGNVAKVLRLPHQTTFDTLQNTFDCHEMPRLPRETKQRDMWNLQKWPFCRTYLRHGHTGLAGTVADGCGWLRTVANINATSSEDTLNPQTPRVKPEPLLRIRELN